MNHFVLFPSEWSEWNDQYRDDMRRFWRGDEDMIKKVAKRFAGSSDLYEDNYRGPTASINFITAHDGFTLSDLVSFNQKHNEGNKGDNKDGINENYSWNSGAEGPTNDSSIENLRALQKRNFLATLMLSQGIPMLTAGDEIGRTQSGNNNAYCQDNEISWLHWDKQDSGLLEFVRKLIRMRKEHPDFARRSWFTGKTIESTDLKDISWFQPNGNEMNEEEWNTPTTRTLGIYLNGQELRLVTKDGNKIVNHTFFVILNASHEPVNFMLPSGPYYLRWLKVLDTICPNSEQQEEVKGGDEIRIEGRTLVVLMELRGEK